MREEAWLEKYELAKEYYEEHGNLKIPQNYIVDGVHLGVWVVTQRQVCAGKRRGNLTQEKIDMLDDIGMIWQPEDGKKELWEIYYQKAKEYYHEHGNLLIPLEYTADGLNVGRWIDRQRQIKKGNEKGNLTKDRVKLLNEIEMRWEIKKRKQKGTEKAEKKRMAVWEANYQKAKEYYETYGNLEVHWKYEQDGLKLGRWIATQRQRRKGAVGPEMTQDEIAKLDNLTMRWENIKNPRRRAPGLTREQYREKCMELVRKYYEEHGNIDIPQKYEMEGIQVGIWMDAQRRKRKKGEVPESCIEELDKMGMNWCDRHIMWEEGYQAAKKYYEEHGNLKVRYNYVTEDGLRLGRWIKRRRTVYNQGKMQQDQIDKLNEIEMIWRVKRQKKTQP